MWVYCCKKCRYENLFDAEPASVCPKCGGEFVSLNIKSLEWNKLNYDEQNKRIGMFIPNEESIGQTFTPDYSETKMSVEEDYEEDYKKEEYKKVDYKHKDIKQKDCRQVEGGDSHSAGDSKNAGKKRNRFPIIIAAIAAGIIILGVISYFVVNLLKTHLFKEDNSHMAVEKTETVLSENEGDTLEKNVSDDNSGDEAEDNSPEEDDYVEEGVSFTETRDWKTVKDSTLKISYELETDESPDYIYDKEPVVIGYEDGYFSTFVMSFSEDVYNLNLFDLKSDIDDDGTLIIREKEPIDGAEEISANTPVYIYPWDLGETVPLKGFSIMDSDYKTHHFYFQLSGMDGSAIVEEYDSSYINMDYYDVDDEDLPAAHLRGFESMQEAIKHYDCEEYVPEWSVLWVVVEKVDADGTDEEGKKVHDTVEMTEDEVDYYMNNMSYQFKDSVEELSLSHVKINIDTLLYDKPITTLDPWNGVVKDSFDDETREGFKKYNSVVCCVKLSNGEVPKYNLDWLGLGYGLADMSYGFCEVNISSTYEWDRNKNNVYPAEPWIHEWIHTLQPNGTICGTEVGNPDEADKHGYKHKENNLPINGFYEYYGDILSGKIEGGYGFTPGMWRALSKLYSETRE